LTLSSEKNWLYGTGKANENGQSETPNAFPHVFWAESQFLLDQPLNPGDMVRLQKDPSDSAAFYRIDCIDLEVVPEPIPQPANSLSVAEYGAAGKDVETDTAALLKCIADAKFQGKTVYLPPGTYLQNQILRLDGVRVQGAGPWYTTIRDTVGNTSRTWTDSGIKLGGESPALLDLTLEGAQTRRPNGCVAISSLSDEPRNWLVQNVWIKTYGAGIWVGGFDGTVRNCRVRNTYADGITINNGKVLSAERILIENNHVRGCGDDGIAVHSFEASPNPSHHCIIRNNTVVAVWWGSNIAIGGGSDHLIENNLSQDGIGVGLAINMPNAYKKRPAENITIRNNTILRAGTNKNSQRRGAIWINPGYVPVISATIEGNTIVDAIFRGIHVTGPKPSNLTITGNTFINPRGDAIYINPDAAGAATISGNVIQNAKQGAQEVNNRSSENFTLTVQ
jgi:hypothetical protein